MVPWLSKRHLADLSKADSFHLPARFMDLGECLLGRAGKRLFGGTQSGWGQVPLGLGLMIYDGFSESMTLVCNL
jgi:hypothetical protein